jgi:hypothetical protein
MKSIDELIDWLYFKATRYTGHMQTYKEDTNLNRVVCIEEVLKKVKELKANMEAENEKH